MVRTVDAAAHPGTDQDLVRGWTGGGRPRWFCSELVTECCVAAGIMNRETARPAATYPSDLFWGRSYNLYLNFHLDDLSRAGARRPDGCPRSSGIRVLGSSRPDLARLHPAPPSPRCVR